jgi:hypothetical protein
MPYNETLVKVIPAVEVPLYAIFYDGDEKPPVPRIRLNDGGAWESRGADARTLDRFRRLLARTEHSDQQLLILMASKMAGRRNGRAQLGGIRPSVPQ